MSRSVKSRRPIQRHLHGIWLPTIARIVPQPIRTDWREEWDGELCYGLTASPSWRRVLDIIAGMVSDAIDVRRAYHTSSYSRPRGDSVFHRIITHLGFGFRLFRRAPLFTGTVVVTLALGVGATTTIFTVVNSLLLNPLPFPDADRLVIMWQGRSALGVDRDWFSGAQYVDLRDGTDAFEEITLSVGGSSTLMGRGSPSDLGYVRLTSSFFPMIGARPALGRLFDSSDDAEGAPIVAVLSHGLWQRSFGGDPDVVGQTITINQTGFDIVGVLPEDFALTSEILPTVGGYNPMDVVLSLQLSENRLTGRGSENYNVVGKLRPGVTLAQTQAQVDAVAQSIIEQHEQPNTGFFISVVPLLEEVVGAVRRPLVALLGAVFVLLAIACMNVANLLLSRSGVRGRELCIRAALGAGRQRLVEQLLTEHALLAGMGGLLGMGVAVLSLSVLRRIGSESLPRLEEISVDPSVLGFVLILVIGTTVAFGLAPAFRVSRVELAESMRTGGRGSTKRGALWSVLNLPSGLVVLELGLSVVLLIGGGLLLRSFRALEQVDPGFAQQDVTTFRIQLLGTELDDDTERASFFRSLEERLMALPGVVATGGVHILPFGPGVTWGELTVEGKEEETEVITHFRIATPNFFRAMAIPILRGRGLEEQDRMETRAVAVIDQRLAERVFGDADPIGQRIEGWRTDWAEVVGVVGSVKSTGLDENEPYMAYYPYEQTPTSRMFMTVRGADVVTLTNALDRLTSDFSSNLLVADIAPMHQRVGESLASRRFAMILFQAFALVALFLATVGVYGLVAYRVSQGARDLGTRIALGAQPKDILSLVARHGATLALIGVAVGVVGSLGVTRFIETMLFDVAPTDPMTFVIAIVFLMGVTLAACVMPARRASRVDPIESLRLE